MPRDLLAPRDLLSERKPKDLFAGASPGGMLGQFAIGAGNAIAYSIPELLNKKQFEALTSKSKPEQIARGTGTAIGTMVGLPGLAFKIGSKIAMKGAAKLIPELTKSATLGSKATVNAIEGAGGLLAMDTLDPSKPLEEKISDAPRNVISGASMGALLGILPSLGKLKPKTPKEQLSAEITSQPKEYTAPFNPSGRETLTPSYEKVVPSEAKSLIEAIEKSKVEIEAADRGIIPIAEQVKLSKNIKIDQKFYDELQPGMTANTETQWAMTSNLIDQIGQLSKNPALAETISKNFIKADAVVSETARALGARSRVQQVSAEQLKYVVDQFKKLDPEAKEAAERLFSHLKTPGFWDKFMEFRTASLLSSPRTHERNLIGNLMPLLYRPIQKVFSGNVSGLESLLTGKPQEVFSREGLANVIGVFRGMGLARRNFMQAMKDEGFVSDSRVLEAVRFKRAIPGKVGEYIRFPFRFLNASDEFFRTLNHSSSLYEQATNQALKEGAKDLPGRIAELVKSPNPEMISRAAKFAKDQTFQSKTPAWAGKFEQVLQDTRVGKFIIPFFKTPYNLFRYSFQRGPLAFASPKNWSDILKTPSERSEAIAKMVTGQLITITTFMEAMKGNITGRLSGDKRKREALMRQGISPYAIKVGDKWVSYRSLEPLSSWLGLVSNTAEILREKDSPLGADKAAEVFSETVKMMKDQTFLRGISSLMDALDDPEKFGPEFLKQNVTSLIPATGAVGYLATLQDPVIRDPDTLPDQIKSRLPYLSKSVEPKLDVWGRPIKRDGTLWERALLPSGVMTSKPDLTEQELLSLEIFPQKITKSYQKIPLTIQERNTVTRVEGQLTKDLLDKITNSQTYKTAQPWEQQAAISKAMTKIRTTVRRQLLNEIKRKRFQSLQTLDEKLEFLEDITRKQLIKD